MALQFTENRNTNVGLNVSTNPRATLASVGLPEATAAETSAGTVSNRYISPRRLSGSALGLTAPLILTGTSVNTFAAGRQGATNPVLNIDASAATVVTGLNIAGTAAGSRTLLSVTSSGTNEGLSIDAKGSGTIRLGATSTGAIEFSRNAVPTASDGAALGTTSLMWSDAFLASGAVIDFNAGNYTLTHSAGALAFSGTILAGLSSQVNVGGSISAGVAPLVEIAGNSSAATLAIIRHTTPGGAGCLVELGSSRGAGIGTFSAVQSGDGLGSLQFFGDNGTNYTGTAAQISAVATATYTTSSMPSRMEFLTTASGSTTPTRRFTIFPDGGVNVGVSTTSPGAGAFNTESTITAADLILSTGTAGGIAMDDRSSGSAHRWYFYAASSAFHFYSQGAAGDVTTLDEAGNFTLNGFINSSGGYKRVSSDFSKTSDTTLANITGLSVSVSASQTYAFESCLMTTEAAAGGVKAAIAGTCTATDIRYQGYIVDSAAIVANTQASALATTVASSTTTGTAVLIHIVGTITVNAAGTLTVQFAQNTSNGTASVVKRGSWFKVWQIT